MGEQHQGVAGTVAAATLDPNPLTSTGLSPRKRRREYSQPDSSVFPCQGSPKFRYGSRGVYEPDRYSDDPLPGEVLYPDSQPVLEALGRSAAQLLCLGEGGPGWVIRRKERVTLIDDSVVRRQMSVDFALPLDTKPLGEISGTPIYYAPLFFLPKGLDQPVDLSRGPQAPEPLFANFDLRDQREGALSLPPRLWNGLLTGEMLRTMIEDTLVGSGVPREEISDGIDGITNEICTSDRRLAELWLERLRDPDGLATATPEQRLVHEADAADPALARMLEVCASSSVAMTPLIGEEARQGIVKLSFDEQVADIAPPTRLQAPLPAFGWAGYGLWVVTPYIGGASYHFEFQAPDGLEIYDAGLVRIDGPEEPQRGGEDTGIVLDRCSGFVSRLHLYERSASDSLKTFAWMRLRVRRQEFIGGAVIAGLFVAAAMWGAYLAAPEASRSPNSVPTLLLLVPSLIAAYAVRPTAHRLTAKMLRNARFALGASAALPFIAAAFLALTRRHQGHLEGHTFEWCWLACACVATVLAFVLICARIFPQPDRHRRRAKEWLQRHLALEFEGMPLPPARPPWIKRWKDGRLGAFLGRLDRWRKSG
jgi:hypothetical protein